MEKESRSPSKQWEEKGEERSPRIQVSIEQINVTELNSPSCHKVSSQPSLELTIFPPMKSPFKNIRKGGGELPRIRSENLMTSVYNKATLDYR